MGILLIGYWSDCSNGVLIFAKRHLSVSIGLTMNYIVKFAFSWPTMMIKVTHFSLATTCWFNIDSGSIESEPQSLKKAWKRYSGRNSPEGSGRKRIPCSYTVHLAMPTVSRLNCFRRYSMNSRIMRLPWWTLIPSLLRHSVGFKGTFTASTTFHAGVQVLGPTIQGRNLGLPRKSTIF